MPPSKGISYDEGGMTSRTPKKMNLKYSEYDLSKIKDPKGGFILEEQTESQKDEYDKKKAIQLDKRLLIEKEDYKCESCGTNCEIDINYLYYFKVPVCYPCRKENIERYSLLTKTECRADYLLTEGELRDSNQLPTWIKPNPHKKSYSNMILYMRGQIEQFAINKWGSLDNLDKEFDRRRIKKVERKRVITEEKIKQLRKRTRSISRKLDLFPQAHTHTFKTISHNKETFESICKCTVCGLTQTMEEF